MTYVFCVERQQQSHFMWVCWQLSAWNLVFHQDLIPGNAIQWLCDIDRAFYLLSASVFSYVKWGYDFLFQRIVLWIK